MKKTIPQIDRVLHRSYFQLYPAEAARHLQNLPPRDIVAVLGAHPVHETLRIWERLAPDLGGRVLCDTERGRVLDVLAQLEPNRAAQFLNNLGDEEQRREFLRELAPQAAIEIEQAMTFPPDTAGALMDTQVVYCKPGMTVREAVVRLKAHGRRGFRLVFLVDDDNRLLGVVEIQDLALSAPETKLIELMHAVPAHVEAMTNREQVVEEFEKYRVTDLPVIDFEGRLLGVIRYHTLVVAAKAESSADIQTMVGVSRDERALSSVAFAVSKRLPWLQINLFTAFLAAAVVGVFESTIAKYTALAVLLPVVAGQSGNTGAQALAVTMRGLALREIRASQWPRVVFKEVNVGLWNGIAVALTTALGVWIWSQSAGLCLVIGVSMILSMMAACLSGAAIPILLTSVGQDPAQSSSIFLTTVTDVVGFLSFLGIASLLAHLL